MLYTCIYILCIRVYVYTVYIYTVYTVYTVYMYTAPAIVQFPEEMSAVEGERVIFRVEVTGSPHPKLTWYHNGEEVVADYSRELAENGSLTLPSAEAKHSGVYQLVAQSPAGRREREVKLSVEAADEKEVEGTPQPLEGSTAIPVAMFGNHVESNHARQNQAFKDEYQVRPPGRCGGVMCLHAVLF